MPVVRTHRRYTSNVRGLQADIDRKLLRIVKAAAVDGAQHIRVASPISARAGEPTITTSGRSSASVKGGVIACLVTYPKTQFWGIMLDKGTLGKRTIPLKQPGRREATWKGRRRARRPTTLTESGYTTSDKVSVKRPAGGGTEVTFHRSAEALASGGKSPEYYFIRGKRAAQRTLAKRLIRGL